MLDDWNKLMGLLRICAELSSEKKQKPRLTPEFVLDPNGPLRDIVRELAPHLARRQMSWDQLDQFLKLRLELFEIDTRFGELGPGGIFNSLDRAGVLQHQFAGVDDIPYAVARPPATGRARVRGDVIERLHGNPNRYGCDWSAIVDADENLTLDLQDPWAAAETWTSERMSPQEHAQFAIRWRRAMETAINGPT